MRVCLWPVLCHCSRISFLPLALSQMSLFGVRFSFSSPCLPEKPDLFTDFLKVKGALLPLIVVYSFCLLSLDEALCVTRQLTSRNKHWSKEDNPSLFLSYQSCQRTIPPNNPFAPFITGFLPTQLSFWPRPPQPGSEISGSGI